MHFVHPLKLQYSPVASAKQKKVSASAQLFAVRQRLFEEGQVLVPQQWGALPEDGHREVGPPPGVNHAVQEALQRHRGCLK